VTDLAQHYSYGFDVPMVVFLTCRSDIVGTPKCPCGSTCIFLQSQVVKPNNLIDKSVVVARALDGTVCSTRTGVLCPFESEDDSPYSSNEVLDMFVHNRRSAHIVVSSLRAFRSPLKQRHRREKRPLADTT
jgi:hypothetical protein